MFQPKLVRNSIVVLGGQALGKMCALITSVVIARHFAVDDVGRLAYALAIAAFLGLWTEFGLTTVLSREVAKGEYPLPHLVSSALLIKLVNYALGLFVMVGWLFLVPTGETKGVLLLCAATAILFDSVTQTLTATSSGLERFRDVTVVAFVTDALRLLAVGIAIRLDTDIRAVAVAYLVTSGTVCAIAISRIGRSLFAALRRPPIAAIQRVYRLASTFVLYGVLLQIYFRIDTVMLGWLRTDHEVGLYSAAYRLLEASLFAPAALMGVLLPHFSKQAIDSPAKNVTLLGRFIPLMFVLAGPVVITVSVFGRTLMTTLYGDKFGAAGPALSILIWTLGIICVNAVFPMFLNSIRRERATVQTFVVAAAVNISLNFVLIPRFGAVGAAANTVVTELLNTILYAWFLRRAVGALGLGTLFLRMGAVIMLVFVTWTIASPYGPLVSVGTMLLTFLVAVMATRLVTMTTIRALVPTVLPSTH